MGREDQKNSINSNDLLHTSQIMEFTNDAFKELRNIFIVNMESSLLKSQRFEMYKLGAFMLMIIFIFLGVWAPYLDDLSIKIWKTKGMLNMIPLYIIKNNSVLEEHILAKEIIAAMK